MRMNITGCAAASPGEPLTAIKFYANVKKKFKPAPQWLCVVDRALLFEHQPTGLHQPDVLGYEQRQNYQAE